jgi:hypothetical protein
VKAVSTHYRALVRAATGQPWAPLDVDSSENCPKSSVPRILGAVGRSPAGGRSHVGPPPSGRVAQVISLQSFVTRPSVRTHSRNTRCRQPRERTGQRAPLAQPYLASKEVPVGVEPNLNSDVIADNDCGCVNCPACCAANALQDGHIDCPALASLDADLQRVVGAWDGLPAHMRKTILALVGFAEPPANANVPANEAGASTPARRRSC